MSATPKEGTAVFMGLSGRLYHKHIYCSDVANALVNFDSGQGASATSDSFFLVPEPCYLIDVSIVTGMADTTKLQVARNSVPTGDICQYVVHVSTIAMRPALNIPFGAGSKITFIQLA